VQLISRKNKRARIPIINKNMKKIKKVKCRAFTEKQLDMLEQYHYLYKKLSRIWLSEEEEKYYKLLALKIRDFIEFD
jgi:hypothetical protein